VASEPFNQAVSRLAQYRPFAHEGRNVEAAVQDLVLGAAAEAEGSFESLDECRTAIGTLWGLEVEIDEIRSTVVDLEKQGACSRSGGGFALAAETLQALQEQASKSADVQRQAFEDWERAVLEVEPALDDDGLRSLRQDLEAWLTAIIRRHGVESALILYPEEPRAKELYAELERMPLDFLPPRSGRVGAVRDRALHLFIRETTPAQREYLANLLNVSYFLTVLSLDPSTQELVQTTVQGHRLYLDTNVLYATLGLSKLSETLSVRRMLDLTKSLGFGLAITPWTLSELQESLRRAKEQVTSRALPPRELAGLIADEVDEESFVTAYWRRYKDKGISPQDFFEFYSALDSLLEQDGIRVVDEGCTRVDRNPDEVQEEVVLLERVLFRFKPDALKEHDVKHRLLIRNLRGAGNQRFSNARFWFLTRDSALPRFSRLTVDEQEPAGLPFCVSVSAWAQTVRSLVPRTEDLDEALVDLLASPYIRYRGGIRAAVVHEVVARIDQYKGTNERFAAQVVMDGAFMRDVAHTSDNEQRATKIDDAIVAAASEAHVKLEVATSREVDEREARRTAEVDAASRQEDLQAAHERIRHLEGTLTEREKSEGRLREQLVETEQRHREAEAAGRSSADQTRQDLEERISGQAGEIEQLRNVLKWVGAAVIMALGIATPAVVIAVGLVEGLFPVAGAVVGGIGLVVLGLSLGIGLGKAWKLLGGVALVIGLVVAILELVEKIREPG